MKRIFVLLVMAMMLVGCAAESDSGSEEAADKEPEPVMYNSLERVMEAGFAQKCTFEYKGESGSATVLGEKYHTIVKSEGQVYHSIYDGDMRFVWAEGSKEGIRITPEEYAESDVKSQYGIFDEETEVAMRCIPGMVTGVSFQPPEDVGFITVTEMVEALFSDW